MTEEQKEILIAKMLDAPSSLSDKELDAIMQNEELRGIYDISAAVSSACIRQPELDMEAEWKRFRPRIRRKPSKWRWILRVAAIFLGVVFASNVVVKIIDNTFMPDPQPLTAEAPRIRQVKDSLSPKMNLPPAETKDKIKPAIDKNHPSVSGQYLAKPEPPDPEAPAPQTDTSIDIDEYLRIQQARVDNDLAMQAAESYIEEYDDLVPILYAAGAYDPEMDNVIRKITME